MLPPERIIFPVPGTAAEINTFILEILRHCHCSDGCHAMTEKALMDELSAAYGPDHLGELLADMNGTLISYGQKAESPVEVTELGRAILLGTVRDIFNGETE